VTNMSEPQNDTGHAQKIPDSGNKSELRRIERELGREHKQAVARARADQGETATTNDEDSNRNLAPWIGKAYVSLNQNARSLPEIRENTGDNTGKPHMTLRAYGSHFPLDVDAATFFHHAQRWIKENDRSAFIQPSNSHIMHIQAAWPFAKKSKDGIVRRAGLRFFIVSYKDDTAAPVNYAYELGEIDRHITLLSVTVERVHDSRCLVIIESITEAGRAMHERLTSYFEWLYPELKGSAASSASSQSREPGPIEQRRDMVVSYSNYPDHQIVEKLADAGILVSQSTVKSDRAARGVRKRKSKGQKAAS
jgi:hypothetical protein